MKWKLIILFITVAIHGSAQDKTVSIIELALKNDDTISSPVSSKVLIAIKEGTQNFKAAIELFPVVPDADAEDSLEQQNKPLILKLEGQFPVANLDFLTVADNGKTYTMEVTGKLNDSTQHFPLNFALIISRNEAVDPNGNLPEYNVRMSFAFVLPPQLFGLQNAPFSITKLILVQASEAAISKLDLQ